MPRTRSWQWMKGVQMVVANILAVCSLVSLTEQWIEWAPWIQTLLHQYRALVDPVWSFLLTWVGWLKIDLPRSAHDFMTFGMVLFIGPATRYDTLQGHDEGEPIPLIWRLIVYAFFICLWPLLLIMMLHMTLIYPEVRRAVLLSFVPPPLLFGLLLFINEATMRLH